MEFIENYDFMHLNDAFMYDDVIASFQNGLNITPISDYKEYYSSPNLTDTFSDALGNLPDNLDLLLSISAILDGKMHSEGLLRYGKVLALNKLMQKLMQNYDLAQNQLLEKIIFQPLQKSYEQTLAIEIFMQVAKIIIPTPHLLMRHIIADEIKEIAKLMGTVSYQAYNCWHAETAEEKQKAWNKLAMQPVDGAIKLLISPLFSIFNHYAPHKLPTPIKHVITNSITALCHYYLNYDYKMPDQIMERWYIEDVAFSPAIEGMVPKDFAFPYFVAGSFGEIFKLLA